eukprot:scaffold3628_cov112-Cylindrotheca_fusiformis.AAC.1
MSKAPSYPGDWSATGSTSNGMSQNESSTGGDSPQPLEYTAPAVANREEKAVTRAKFLFFFVLLLAVCGTAAATFLLMENQERNDFEAAFAGLGSEVSTVARQKVDQIFSAMDTFSVFISSEVEVDPNERWPFVTVRHYSLKAEKVGEM